MEKENTRGGCEAKCLHCTEKNDHPCYDKECPKWVAEAAICKLKVERNLSFYQARQAYEKEQKQKATSMQGERETFASVAHKTNTSNVTKIQNLEEKVENLTDLMHTLIERFNQFLQSHTPQAQCSHSSDEITPNPPPRTSQMRLEPDADTDKESDQESETGSDLIAIMDHDDPDEMKDDTMSQTSAILPRKVGKGVGGVTPAGKPHTAISAPHTGRVEKAHKT